MGFVRVALDVPLPTLFDYHAATATGQDIGKRALVPFGRKIVVGVIIELASTTTLPLQRIRKVLGILDDMPPLPSDILALFKFCSDYYHHPLGEVVLSALPAPFRRRQALEPGMPTRCRLTPAGRLVDVDKLPRRPKIESELLRRLAAEEEGIDAGTLRASASRAGAALRKMIAQGWIERVAAGRDQPPAAAPRFVPGPPLTDEQRTAINELRGACVGFTPWLLLGVTGSGKTEVYLHLIADALARGKQALLLVPEINLTPQLEAVMRARFPDSRLVALHSGLNESERLHNWLAAQSGEARLVLGTRLAVFTPLAKPGIIIVDEEQDASFKQMDGLRYSARDLALWRAKRCAIPIVLGSATPALETFQKALNTNYRMLTLTRRVNAMQPAIECIDTRHEPLIDGLSQTLLGALRASLKRGEQSLIFINRRGFAPVLACLSCGWTSGCARCSAKLVLHLADSRLRCHHCGHLERIPAACPQCGNQDLKPLGQGTQRIENALARIFPMARILRIDRDSTRRKQAWNEMRGRIHAQDVDILVGTQIVAKGHDFPQLNLVGVMHADSSLYSTDFRAGEHLFARLTQVAGRAGRGATRGRVLIQTEFPAHPLYQALRRDDYAAFAKQLLAERQQAGFPPFVFQAVLRAESLRLESALDFLAQAVREGASINGAVTIYDPVPASMMRLAGLERAQLTVQSRSRRSLHAFLRAWRICLERVGARKVRWALDVDPLEL